MVLFRSSSCLVITHHQIPRWQLQGWWHQPSAASCQMWENNRETDTSTQQRDFMFLKLSAIWQVGGSLGLWLGLGILQVISVFFWWSAQKRCKCEVLQLISKPIWLGLGVFSGATGSDQRRPACRKKLCSLWKTQMRIEATIKLRECSHLNTMQFNALSWNTFHIGMQCHKIMLLDHLGILQTTEIHWKTPKLAPVHCNTNYSIEHNANCGC